MLVTRISATEHFATQNNCFEFMLADGIIATIDLSSQSCDLVNRELLPFPLYNVPQHLLYHSIIQWIKQRTLPISRKHHSQILKACGLSSTEDILPLLNHFHALSLVDNYWFRSYGSQTAYASVNLHTNHFNELIPVALWGEQKVSLQDNSPDLNLRGNMAKCFKREGSQIFIYKTSAIESKIKAEVFASNLAIQCGFDSVHYVQEHHRKLLCSKCLIETTPQISWIPARDIAIAGYNPKDIALHSSPDRYYQMQVFDYLAGNIDRHNENWSFEMDNSGKLLGLSKLYDFDNCFLAGTNDVSKITLRPSLKEAIIAAESLNLSEKWFVKVQGFLNSQQNDFSEYSKRHLQILKSKLS